MWLIKPDVLQAMRMARTLGYQPTLEERAQFAAAMREAYAAGPNDRPRNMQVAGSTAQINVDGVLTEKPDCIALIFGSGNTTYESIRRSLALAQNDPEVKDIVLNIASPGGHVEGLFETFAALDAVTKQIRVRSSLAASAAFGLAAVAGPIEAVTPASEFGSIGVAASFFLDADLVDIASTDAPKKRPDLSTDEGKAMVREELDALHELFAGAIARGRAATTGEDITLATVNAEFGQGGMFTARSAQKRGMIDRIAAQPKRTRMGRGAWDDAGQITMAQVAVQLEAALRAAAPELPVARVGDVVQVVLGTPAAAPDAGEIVATVVATTETVVTAETESSAEPVAPAVEAAPIEDASAVSGGAKATEQHMNIETLKAQHPELYAAVLKEGTDTERKRCVDHIKVGTASGDIDAAHKAIASGASLADMQADYLAASMKRNAVDTRQTETDAAAAVVDGAKKDAAPKAGAEQVAELVDQYMDGKLKM